MFSEQFALKRAPLIEIILKLVDRTEMKWYISNWAGVQFPGRSNGFSLLHSVQIGPGAHPASYPMGTGDSFSGGNAAGA
jgi:hypothetical protein